MDNERLTHDASRAAAFRMTEVVASLLREEEQTDFYHESYRIIRAAIEAYSIQKQRELRRLNPSKN